MIDMETASTQKDAVILSLAVVKFDRFDPSIQMDGEIWYPDIDDQSQYDRHVDDDTLAWWATQGEEAIELAFGDTLPRKPLDTVMDEFHKAVWNSKTVWTMGTIFDITILEDLLKTMKRPTPWNFRQVRDVRTLFDIGIPYTYNNPIKHDALSDCVTQAVAVQEIYKQIREVFPNTKLY